MQRARSSIDTPRRSKDFIRRRATTAMPQCGAEMLLDEGMVIAVRDFLHYFGELSSLTISACPLRRA
jgi:hypothetical protein